MTQHKWHKEIKAWADGAEIEYYAHDRWEYIGHPQWHLDYEYRIKPQPKEKQYLYAIQTENKGVLGGEIRLIPAGQMFSGTLIGKIEVNDDYLI